jgi:ferric-dicitrate binding protein FerR (iron transport regulator)
MSRALQELGRKVASEQDAQHPHRAELARARAGFLKSLERPAQRRMHLRFALAVTALLAVGFGVGHFAGSNRAAPALSLQIGDRLVEPSRSALAAPAERPLTLDFSDGSQVRLDARSQMHVERLDSVGAQLRLSRGRAQLAIVHRGDTRWTLEAGPLTTHVVGTRFAVAWLPEQEEFELTMQEGAVEVSGPVVGTLRLTRGEGIRVSLKKQSMSLGPLAPAEPPAADASAVDEAMPPTPQASFPHREALQASPSAPRVRRVPGRSAAHASEETPSSPSPSEAWPAQSPRKEDFDAELARLSAEGRYAEAVDAARRAGWQDTLAQVSVTSLARLGDAARLSQDAALAREVYVQLRARFPRSREATQAAYALGRIAHDGRAGFAEAALWFALYLEEAPTGPLAREAMGRLLEAQLQNKAHQEAHATAQRYLQSFPEGPHAELARRVTAAPSNPPQPERH